MTNDIFKKQLQSKRLADLTNQELHLDYNHNLIPDHKPEIPSELSNGGCGHTKNPAAIMHRFFKHRSLAETYMTEACHQRGILYSPNAVIACGYHRIEVDFVLFHLGSVLLLELDGPHHRLISEQEEFLRIRPLLDNGFEVIRRELPPIMSMKFANDVLDEMLEKMERAA
jgi:hypothetical protein